MSPTTESRSATTVTTAAIPAAAGSIATAIGCRALVVIDGLAAAPTDVAERIRRRGSTSVRAARETATQGRDVEPLGAFARCRGRR
jgi:hypothetical protein